MDEELVTAAWQPAFEYRPDVNALAKLFAGPKRRKRSLEGRTLCFQLGSNGIRWTDTDEEVTARWDEVSDVWQRITRRSMNGVPTFTEYMIKLKLVDGRTKRLSGTLRPKAARESESAPLAPMGGQARPVTIEQLGRLIQRGVTNTQLPRAIETFKAGQAISFGPLVVNAAGISHGGEMLEWSEMEGVSTSQGVVSVKKSGKWLAWKKAVVGEIPNYFVFQELVQAILNSRRSGEVGETQATPPVI